MAMPYIRALFTEEGLIDGLIRVGLVLEGKDAMNYALTAIGQIAFNGSAEIKMGLYTHPGFVASLVDFLSMWGGCGVCGRKNVL